MATFNLETSKIPTVGLLDYSILNGDLDKIKFNSKCLINTINQYSYIIAQKDSEFKKALMHSDVLLPDGVGITAALKVLKGENVKKIAGADLHQYLLEKLNRDGGSCFYLGSKDSTLQAIETRLKKEYPNIKVGVYSPPFKAQFSDQEDAEMINAVNEFKPDVLFVGMTAPKQEKWSYLHKDELRTKVICPIGAVFDFYAETITRPSQFWVNLGLEWFIRLVKEPKRMSKRYLYYGPVFAWDLLKMKIGLN
jgi:N-acetylglucosaminyldiphosphoundecaprenol N-acetyl-beta-D-mannosaminyltransferase